MIDQPDNAGATACDPPNSGVACTNAAHDHFGQIAAAENGTGIDTGTDQLVCADCARPMHYDEPAGDYFHDDPADAACFLIRRSTPAEPVDETGADAWIHAEILDSSTSLNAQTVDTPDGPTSPWVETCCICDAPTTLLHRWARHAEWLPYCDVDLPLGGETRIYAAPATVGLDVAPVGAGRFVTSAEQDRIARTGTIR